MTIYLLILAGSLVRVSGSGMGCPDWPRCFEQFVPPTSESELRPDYKQYYEAKTGHEIATFNVFHTYTEYINRLIAVITGFIAIAMAIFSFSYKKENKKFILFSFLVLIAIGF
ncbi:MAG: COX15/CtaA family protein, partial [Bacteroidetes bacterium]|nr:COX15/CtaA family protein [Bacteroidota bacterium]